MDVTIILILAGVLAAGLGVLVLRLGKRLAIFLLTLGVLVVMGAGAFALAAQAKATQRAAQAAAVAAAGQAVTSAATSITIFLLVLILLAGGAIFAYLWLQVRRQNEHRRKVLEAAQMYGLTGGQRLPVRRRRPILPHRQASGPVIILPPAGQQSPTGITLDDLARAVQAAQGRDPFDGFLPPDGDGWEVVQ